MHPNLYQRPQQSPGDFYAEVLDTLGRNNNYNDLETLFFNGLQVEASSYIQTLHQDLSMEEVVHAVNNFWNNRYGYTPQNYTHHSLPTYRDTPKSNLYSHHLE